MSTMSVLNGRASNSLAALLLMVSLSTMVGCATTQNAQGEKESKGTSRIQGDPMLFKASKKGAVESIDSQEVFDKAYEAYSDRRYEEAAKHYEVVIRYFDDSRFYQPALYNGGLAYEKLGRWESAAQLYKKIIEEFPDRKDTSDAYYRLAEAYKQMGRHQEVVETMTEVLLREEMDSFDRIEAHSRRGQALVELGEVAEAEDEFRSVIDINKRAPADTRLPSDSRYIVKAYFGLGKVFHERVSRIKLTLPTESMGEDLKDKAELLMRAQSHYLAALRQHHPHWSVASGYMIGQLYEDFYSDIYAAEIPADLTDEQVHMYFEELRSKIRPLMKKAIDVYEKNLSLSRRIGETEENNRWVRETTESLDRMKAFMNDPKVQRRAEKLALKGRDFRVLWQPYEMAVELVDSAVTDAMKQVSEDRQAAKEAEEKTGEPGS
jgi:tetratricopeptide (TPR) repeat protein